jgi:predicted acetyltransferase
MAFTSRRRSSRPAPAGAPDTALLTLRPPTPADEKVCLRANTEFGDFPFLLLWNRELPWPRYLELLEGLRTGARIPDGLVHSDFLLAEVDGAIVGRVSIRYALNAALAEKGGHVGYGVRPAFRRRGFASEILRQSLGRIRGAGIERVLVVCDDDNVGSATVIERCGGVLESVVTPDDGSAPFRRYWIEDSHQP